MELDHRGNLVLTWVVALTPELDGSYQGDSYSWELDSGGRARGTKWHPTMEIIGDLLHEMNQTTHIA